jgi:hypothetical protein
MMQIDQIKKLKPTFVGVKNPIYGHLSDPSIRVSGSSDGGKDDQHEISIWNL